MSEETSAGERFAIGISFGNSSSSIAFTGPVSLRILNLLDMERVTYPNMHCDRMEKPRSLPTKKEVRKVSNEQKMSKY